MASSREEPPPSKKRVALRQISKDDDPDSEEDDGAATGVTFRRASDEVLAERRMVKVRRNPVPSSTPNPFASIRLTAPSIPFPQAPVVSPTTSLLNSSSVVSKSVVGEADVQVPPAAVVQDEAPEDREKVEAVIGGDVTEQEGVALEESQKLENNSFAPLVKDGAVVGDVSVSEKTPGLVDDGKTPRDNSTSDNVANGAAEKVREVETVGPSGTSSETFEQLSSAKNAFAGSFGTGFSSSPSIFSSSSSASSQASSGFAFGQPFTFGAQRFGSSISFGAGQSQSPFGSNPGSQGGFASVPTVFGKSNGTGSTPIFGSFSPVSAVPASVPSKPAVVALQEVLVETGEEKERAIFTADAALFEFYDGGWKERGKGELRLNVSQEKDKRPRLVMRSKGNYRLLLNASLFPDMKLSKMDNRGISFVCANSAAEGKTGLTTYAVRLKDGVVAAEFTATVQAHKGNTNSEPRTPESSPKDTERPSKVVEASEIEA